MYQRIIHYYKSNSKSESESSSFLPLKFFGAGTFVRVLAERMREEASSSSMSSMSESASLSSPSGLGTCGMIAPPRISTASSSAERTWNSAWTAHMYRTDRHTFDAPFAVSTPGNKLVQHLALPVDDEHGQPHVGEIRYAFVAHDRDELGVWVSLCENVYKVLRAIAMRDTAREMVRRDRGDHEQAYPSL